MNLSTESDKLKCHIAHIHSLKLYFVLYVKKCFNPKITSFDNGMNWLKNKEKYIRINICFFD